MRSIPTILLLMLSSVCFSQNTLLAKYHKADSLLEGENYLEAYNLLKEIEPKCDKNDTIYSYILWDYVTAVTNLESQNRLGEKFDKSLQYGLEALPLIEKGIPYFNPKFAARKWWMTKNIIVSYFGLDQLDKAAKYRDILYKGYKDKILPEGIDQYFNFTYFKWDNKNVWGYEWYPELGDPETKGSFSKIVYYVYSTKPDGSDNAQLYRLHVLKFHKFDNTVKFDYVLTKRLETARDEVSGTLYAYTYDKKIDYKKLQEDIVEVLNGNYGQDKSPIIRN